jgi:hypothetical protein
MTQPLSGTAVVDAPIGTAWDYMIASIHARHTEMLENGLKERGKQGWELVYVHMPVPFEYLCMFKRPLR